MSRNVAHAFLYCQMIIEILVSHHFAIHFHLKIENEIKIKWHCWLLFDSEPLITTMIYIQVYTYHANSGTWPEDMRVTGAQNPYK